MPHRGSDKTMKVQDDASGEFEIDRRKALKFLSGGAAAVATGGLAGCSGDGGSDDTDGSSGDGSDGETSSGGSSERIDTKFVTYTTTLAESAQFNEYNPKNQHHARQILFMPLAFYNPVDGEFLNVLASDWSFTGDSATLTLRDQTWDTGKKLTAEDLVTQLHIEKALDGSMWQHIESVEATGERTVEFSPVPKNAAAFEHALLPLKLATPSDQFGEYATALEEASTDSELKSAKNDLFSLSLTEPDQVPSNSSITFTRRTQDRLFFDVRESGHPHLDNFNFNGVIYETTDPQQGRASLFQRGIDWYAGAITKDSLDNQAPSFVQYARQPVFQGMSLEFNFQNDLFKRREMRQAIAYLTNRQAATNNGSKLFYSPVPTPAGLVGTISGLDEQWLEGNLDQFDTYGHESAQPNSAASVLRDAGYSKSGGKWMLPSGDPVPSFEVKAPSGWSWGRTSDTVVSSLKDFGFDVEYSGIESGTLYGETYPSGDYDLIANWWGNGVPYPTQSLQTMFNMQKSQDPSSIPTTMEIPAFDDPNGDPQQVNVESLFNGLADTASPEEAKPIVQEIAWAVNQGLPKFPIMEKTDTAILNTQDWNFPDFDGPVMGMANWFYYSIDRGLIKAKQKSPTQV